MAFVRTTNGLKNQHLFHNVDCVIFVEGGKSYTKMEIEQGKYDEESIDTIFWSKILKKYKPDTKFKFKAIGSKSAIVQVAEDIIDNNHTTVYVAMDQEFDTILAKLYKHKNILYTFGYSWENDVWNEDVIRSITKTLSAKKMSKKEVTEPFKRFLKEAKFSVYADGYLFSKGNSFFPRPSNHLKLIDCCSDTPPFVKKGEIEELWKEIGLKKSSVYSFGSRKGICVRTNCYGHLLGDFCKLLVKHLMKVKHKMASPNDEIIRRMAIDKFLKFIPKKIDSYYKQILT